MAERIAFDSGLYSREAVQAAAQAYAEVAKIELVDEDGGFTAVISDAGDYDESTIAHAFANHVLHETISGRSQAALED